MRIIAGSARGRGLKGPRGPGLRPTSDRVRESIFNILGQWLDGARVLDLFAGTGALALEALSRGAAHAVLLDSGREAQRLCRDNASALGFLDRVKIVAAPVSSGALAGLARQGPFDLIFADPPYGGISPAALLELIASSALAAPGARVVLEHDRRSEAPGALAGFTRVDTRRFGDTQVSFYETAPVTDAAREASRPPQHPEIADQTPALPPSDAPLSSNQGTGTQD